MQYSLNKFRNEEFFISTRDLRFARVYPRQLYILQPLIDIGNGYNSQNRISNLVRILSTSIKINVTSNFHVSDRSRSKLERTLVTTDTTYKPNTIVLKGDSDTLDTSLSGLLGTIEGITVPVDGQLFTQLLTAPIVYDEDPTFVFQNVAPLPAQVNFTSRSLTGPMVAGQPENYLSTHIYQGTLRYKFDIPYRIIIFALDGTALNQFALDDTTNRLLSTGFSTSPYLDTSVPTTTDACFLYNSPIMPDYINRITVLVDLLRNTSNRKNQQESIELNYGDESLICHFKDNLQTLPDINSLYILIVSHLQYGLDNFNSLDQLANPSINPNRWIVNLGYRHICENMV